MRHIKKHINRYMFKYLSIAYLIAATYLWMVADTPLLGLLTAVLIIGSLVFLDFAMTEDLKRKEESNELSN